MSRKNNRIVKSNNSWHRELQLKKIKITMVVVVVALCISVLAGAAVLWSETGKNKIADPLLQVSSALESQTESEAEREEPFELVVASESSKLPDYYKAQPVDFAGIEVDARILPSLQAMIEAAKKSGVDLNAKEGYVSAEEEDRIFAEKVAALVEEQGYTQVRAEETVQKEYGRGGYSERQTVLTVWFTADSEEEASAAAHWLSNYAVDYGFILRYPDNHASDTGKSYDPLAYRYVGKEHAKKICQFSMCLEDYVSYLAAR